jgi:hypothetical protein
VQRDPHGLDPGPIPGDLGQVVGQQPAGPQGAVHPDLVGVAAGDPPQLVLPFGWVVGWLTGVGPVRHRVDPTGLVAAEHPAHGVAAAPGDARDLDHRAALVGQQQHLVAGAGLGVAGGVIAAFQLGPGSRVQPDAQWWGHVPHPLGLDQET